MTQSSFEYLTATIVIGGPGSARHRTGASAARLGSRALLVCGNRSAQYSGALDDVTRSLDEHDVSHVLLEGITTNPGAAVVDAGVQLARVSGCDMVIGVGGGSVIDVAKAIAVGVKLGDAPIRTLLSGIRTSSTSITSALPVIAVPTMPGSGSETNGTSVLIDETTGRKLSLHSDLATPRIALLDGTYVLGAPRAVLAPALGDALCHAIEAALSRNATIASNTLARAAALTLREHAPLVLALANAEARADNDKDDADHDDRAAESLLHCLWAAGLAGQALTLAGSIVTHPLSHPISARLGTHHGVAVSALEATVITELADRWQPGRTHQVADWLDPHPLPQPTSDAAAAHQLAARLASFNESIGNTRSLADEGLVEEMIPEIVADCLASGSRGLANVAGEALTESDLSQLLAQALAPAQHDAPSSSQATDH